MDPWLKVLEDLVAPLADSKDLPVLKSEKTTILALALLCGEKSVSQKSWDLFFRYVSNYRLHGSKNTAKLVYGLQAIVKEGATIRNLKSYERYVHAFFRTFPEECTSEITLTIFTAYYLVYFRRKSIWTILGKVVITEPINRMLDNVRKKYESGEINTPFFSYIASLVNYIAAGYANHNNSIIEYCVHKSLRDCMRVFLMENMKEVIDSCRTDSLLVKSV